MSSLSLRGGRLIDPAHHLDAELDLHLADGRVVGAGRPPAGFVAERTIDVHGRIVCPGLIDLAARLREPGHEHKGTIASESRAAARNGITTLVCPPDTDPVIDEPAVVELIRRQAKAADHSRVLALGALTRGLRGEQLAEMALLKQAGCVGVANAGPVPNTLVMKRALEYAASHGLTVFLTPQDPWLSAGGNAHDGEVAARLGLNGIPVAAETAAVGRDIALIEETGVRAHFCRLSSARAVAMVARARARGLQVSCDVAAHQLHLSEIDLGRFDADAHVLPPLRSLRDRDALRRGVAEGVIEAVCSDHQPHEPDAKEQPFGDTEPGISALDTLLALNLKLVDEGALDLSTAIERLTAGPARILGLGLGQLDLGAVADVCVFDPERHRVLDAAGIASRGHNTPFRGRTLRGAVTHTLVEGRVVFEEGRP